VRQGLLVKWTPLNRSDAGSATQLWAWADSPADAVS